MPRVSKETIQEILTWLSQHKIDCVRAKLHRQFSNGVVLATLLKELHPRLVELHNYPPQNSLRLKMQNLETLNSKVLSKLGLQQKQTTLVDIAKGTEGAIEPLLYNLMTLEKDEQKRKESELSTEDNENVLMQEGQVLEIKVNKKIGDALVKVPQRMVLYSMYEKTIQKTEQKREQLKILEMRLYQAENELEQRRTEVEKLIKHEENREYRKRLSVRSNANNGLQRLDEEHYSPKLYNLESSVRPPAPAPVRDSKSICSSKIKPEDKTQIKISANAHRKANNTSSLALRRDRKSTLIPMYVQNVK